MRLLNHNMKKPALVPPRNRLTGLTEPYGKCRGMNHTTPECRTGSNRCLWCIAQNTLLHPQRLKTTNIGAVRPPLPPRQGPLPPFHQRPPPLFCQGPPPPPRQGLPLARSARIGRAYVISKKEATTFVMVVTSTLFLNPIPFCVLFDSGATHSFICT